eukprot:TRINITY_DN5775_c0_g3_i4.p1 TRINITY_DN5775_c0_g3~~TRINITY_DN5775_c0_g3_i4.p1  ORF type:complete len:1201 (+),score=238.65 TRINITY_DN5775_c0_g3_i4:1107-4709(+)
MIPVVNTRSNQEESNVAMGCGSSSNRRPSRLQATTNTPIAAQPPQQQQQQQTTTPTQQESNNPVERQLTPPHPQTAIESPMQQQPTTQVDIQEQTHANTESTENHDSNTANPIENIHDESNQTESTPHQLEESAPNIVKNEVTSQPNSTASNSKEQLNDPVEQPSLDENLQSRQLAVYGRQAMGQLARAHVIISGLNGLGAEIAKNLALANVHRITLHDPKLVRVEDLSANFFLTPADVGFPRSDSCMKKVQELNPTVKVDTIPHPLTEEDVLAATVVILIESTIDDALRINDICRSKSPTVHFIRVDVRGIFGSIFNDFGDTFICHDTNGEEVKTAIIANITKDKEGVVTCVSDERVDFEDGDHVVFSEIEGMTELNNCTPIKITNVKPFRFCVGDTTQYSDYVRGGLVTQVKIPKTISFLSLQQSIQNPGEFLLSDFSKIGRSELLHAAFQAIDQFVKTNHRLPLYRNEQDAIQLIHLTQQLYHQQITSEEENIIRQLSYTSESIISPMAAVFGGIAGQEVIKACTGKFHPIHQWLYMDFLETLPSGDIPAEEFIMTGDRYDPQVAIFGRSLQNQLLNLKYFMVGAGALGCEFLKNFALMGIACGPEGLLTLTDDDTIEKSNLTRQFLFRNWMIGQSKSSAAANVVKSINPLMKIKDMQDRVSNETETIFHDDFWESLDGVCNALDNVKARLYVDSKCVFYNKPLLESGTLGTKCNTQIVIPHLTENYGASTDPPEKVAPDCTLHNFPHNIQHCLSWARSDFIGTFETTPTDANTYHDQKSAFIQDLQAAGTTAKEIREKLLHIKNMISQEKCQTFDDCIRWARLKFEDMFVNRIKQLIHIFPQDAVTTSGAPFWSPPKRFPCPLFFDPVDPVHMQFLIAASNLRAHLSQIYIPETSRDPEYYENFLTSISVPEFTPSSDVKIETDESKPEASAPSSSNPVPEETPLHELLSETDWDGINKFQVIHFEKDDDTNFHMDYISAVGNLRARNYEIKEVDKLQAKLIAGRIIPAIATTTAMATGFVCLELYKILQKKPLESFRNTFANLAIPIFALSEPMPPAKTKTRVVKNIPDPLNHPEYEEEETVVAYPEGHTVWDRLDVNLDSKENATLRQLIEHFETVHSLKTQSISLATPNGGGVMLYNIMLPYTHSKLDDTIGSLFEKYTGRSASSFKYIFPTFGFCDQEGNFVESPLVVYHLR